MILADKIIWLRKREGMSQEELAEKMNVSRQAVSKWESAQSLPDIDKILQISRMFNVTTDYLLKDEIDEVNFSSISNMSDDTRIEKIDTDDKSNRTETYCNVQQKHNNYPLSRIVSSSYWSLVTAIYLIWSFVGDAWDISWLIWPLSPLLYTPIVILCREIDKKLQK
ncbi:MAG: helix-turn-helix transcriptional regulator [Oscillospiraceae bacterium]|nr:helix-turn-helix transcriptional regulator [Oscillospiraceae bacterium]